MKLSWFVNKRNLFFVTLFILDITLKLVVDNGALSFFEVMERAANYFLLAVLSPLVFKAKNVKLDSDNNIFLLMLSVVLFGFSVSVMGNAYSTFTAIYLNKNIFIEGYQQFSMICIAILVMVSSLILLLRSVKFMLKKR